MLRQASQSRIWTTALAALTVGACAVGPDYEAPSVSVADQFTNISASDYSQADVRADFWTIFGDPTLNALVEAALETNKDLDVARANLRASRAARRLTGFDSYPTVTARAAHTNQLQSEQQRPGLARDQREGSALEAGFDASWELDLFGRVRRGREAAEAEEQAAQAQLQDAQVTVTAEVARNYFVLRGLQEQLDVATRNALNQERTLALTVARLNAGRGTELDRSRADAQWKTTLASIPPLESSIASTVYRQSILTGEEPSALEALLAAPRALQNLPLLNAVSSPDALLRRRPDVRVAERELAASTARIGIAVGDLFPKVTFISSVGYSSTSFSALGDPMSETFSYGPRISWAAFDLGRVRARIDIAEARAEAALARYELAVLTALGETETALIAYGNAQSRRSTLQQAAASSSTAADLARRRFEGGLADFLNVLDAERDALIVQDSLAQSRTQTATALIALYKALGGGWTH